MQEKWRDIPEYEGLYQASTLGRIKSLKNNRGNDREKYLKGVKDKKGYLRVILCKNKTQKIYLVHRLIALTFMGEPISKTYYFLNHKDENPSNNKLENLEYCTHKYNDNYGTRNERLSKPVIGINKINGYICEFNSIKEAGRVTGINFKNISGCCSGNRKSAGGYIWMYKK